jgi:hypothetical protein
MAVTLLAAGMVMLALGASPAIVVAEFVLAILCAVVSLRVRGDS